MMVASFWCRRCKKTAHANADGPPVRCLACGETGPRVGFHADGRVRGDRAFARRAGLRPMQFPKTTYRLAVAA